MSEHRVFTVGYTGWRPEALMAACEALNARVVDIRYAPRSRAPQWGADALSSLLGDRYVPCRALGNEAYRERGVRLHDPEAGVAAIAEALAGSSVILLCACADPEHCHRTPVGALLRDRLGVDVCELDDALAAREAHQPALFEVA